MKKWIVSLILGVVACVSAFMVSAEGYSTDFPMYVPLAGGAWCQATTSAGEITVLVPADFITDTFTFSGDGYNIANATNSTVSGVAYHKDRFSYYGSPDKVQCRFQSMGTLQVYEPYQSNYGNTAYRWTDVKINKIIATSIRFSDDKLDRQNDNYRYTTGEKIGICIFIAVLALVILKIFRRGRLR